MDGVQILGYWVGRPSLDVASGAASEVSPLWLGLSSGVLFSLGRFRCPSFLVQKQEKKKLDNDVRETSSVTVQRVGKEGVGYFSASVPSLLADRE